MNKSANETADKTAKAPEGAPAPKNINTHDIVVKTKKFIADELNSNLEMCIAVVHLVKLDLERMYNDQLRFHEFQIAQQAKIADDVRKQNAAAAQGDLKATDAPGIEVASSVAPETAQVATAKA